MRIAVISTPHIPTPPRGYGASELIAGLLAEGLQRRGHDVHLFACAGSTERVSECRSFRETTIATTFEQRELIHVGRALDAARDCDLIHNHCLAVGPAFSRLVETPFLTTLHYLSPSVHAFPDAAYVAVSDQQMRSLPTLNILGRVYNGIDLEQFPLSLDHDDYLLFLGRFHPNKGADHAIDVARRLDRRLLIAAPDPPDDQRAWFEQHIRPLLTGKIEWIGPVEGDTKARLLGRAAATLLPVRWDEPFGLVAIESMACGTPPIAIRRGALPELIVDGVSGYLVDAPDDLASAVERVSQLDRAACRRHVEQHFSADRMVDAYVALYQDYLMRSCASRTNTKLGTGTPSS
jgi:glycosyltransferase involved in cell wall biosynthesis